MKVKKVYLNDELMHDIINKGKYVGSGVDGVLYKTIDNKVYKFYRDNTPYIDVRNIGNNNDYYYDENENEQVNVTDYKKLRNNKIKIDDRIIKYKDKDDVILSKEEALSKAMEKQKYVYRTMLPNGIIYVNGKVSGCMYDYCPASLGIYATTYLPLKMRLRICKAIMVKVKELLDNNIYPISLSQNNDEVFPISKAKSNILLTPIFNPEIIDLDGNSTLYFDKYSDVYYKRVESELSTLILELLTRIKLNLDQVDDSNIDSYINTLIEAGIPEKVVEQYIDYCSVDIYDLAGAIKHLEKKKIE